MTTKITKQNTAFSVTKLKELNHYNSIHVHKIFNE